jgi:hypothetical protein
MPDTLLALGFALGLTATALHAQAQEDKEKPEPRLLTVKADAYVEVEPEIAKISLGIEAVKPKPKEAATEVAQKADAVKAKLAGLGVPQESVETSELYLGQVFEYDAKRRRRVPRDYRAYHWLRVTLKNEDFDKLATVVDGAVDAGATAFYGFRFEMDDDTAMEAEALAKAVRNARQKAEAMAEAAKTRIVGVHSISELHPEGWAYPELAEAAEPEVQEAAPPAEAGDFAEEPPGKLRITCEVEVAFLLE